MTKNERNDRRSKKALKQASAARPKSVFLSSAGNNIERNKEPTEKVGFFVFMSEETGFV